MQHIFGNYATAYIGKGVPCASEEEEEEGIPSTQAATGRKRITSKVFVD